VRGAGGRRRVGREGATTVTVRALLASLLLAGTLLGGTGGGALAQAVEPAAVAGTQERIDAALAPAAAQVEAALGRIGGGGGSPGDGAPGAPGSGGNGGNGGNGGAGGDATGGNGGAGGDAIAANASTVSVGGGAPPATGG
jgi:hypothetical protein